MTKWLKGNLAVLVVIGALLDLVVFGLQIELRSSQARTNAKSECWSRVLDHAVLHPSKAYQPILKAEAQRCAALP